MRSKENSLELNENSLQSWLENSMQNHRTEKNGCSWLNDNFLELNEDLLESREIFFNNFHCNSTLKKIKNKNFE